ncbi:glutathione S-transferase family protein [Crenobacter cavernae]|uniref:Glutathione S-transferase family protein n=1 Tax=Crenobacter cavernae TaxID=2290923 RepID=A0ABY0FEF6_9NEIS|nr:glutathione S-transferase family protein [Crenobacter cavernae]RXZ44431.1 glutathione S-transferase family protein [Crenobacter cavernae]
MITLYGTALSPHYAKVRIALIEKGVNYREEPTSPNQSEEFLERSPLGKIPCVEINGQPLAESGAIVEWLEDAYPTAALLPDSPLARAHVRELNGFIEYAVLEATRPLMGEWLWGHHTNDAQRATATDRIEKGLAAILRRARFSPWLAGEAFTLADVTAAAVLPLVALATQQVLGRDLVAELPDLVDYLERLGDRASVADTWAARDALFEALREGRLQLL